LKLAAAAAILAATTCAVSAQEAVPSQLDSAEATMGQVIFVRYCGACHGREGRGDGPVAPGLVRKPTDLGVLAARNNGKFPYDKVVRSIDGRETPRVHGTPDMPVWGEVFAKTTGTEAPNVDTALRRITHYVWSLQQKR
jgi:mono/diheme cytochrome c family protein